MEKLGLLLPAILRGISAFFAMANIACVAIAKQIGNMMAIAQFKGVATIFVSCMVLSVLAMTYVQMNGVPNFKQHAAA